VLKFIRSFFNYATECGHIQRNPTPKIQFRIADKIKGVLNDEQIKILLQKAREYNHPWAPVWEVACYTGMRSGELYALTHDSVDLEGGRIFVKRSWCKVSGMNEYPKNKQDRVIPIAPALFPLLRDLKETNRDSAFILPRLPDWECGRQAEILKVFLLGLNLPLIRFHDLRASFCTSMLSKGVPTVQVMSIGGWSDLKTMTIYLRKAGINIKGATDILDFSAPQIGAVIPILRGSNG
jgi:integrase